MCISSKGYYLLHLKVNEFCISLYVLLLLSAHRYDLNFLFLCMFY